LTTRKPPRRVPATSSVHDGSPGPRGCAHSPCGEHYEVGADVPVALPVTDGSRGAARPEPPSAACDPRTRRARPHRTRRGTPRPHRMRRRTPCPGRREPTKRTMSEVDDYKKAVADADEEKQDVDVGCRRRRARCRGGRAGARRGCAFENARARNDVRAAANARALTAGRPSTRCARRSARDPR